ncbi:MAG: class I SAM-dependent methyltransferase [Terriglobales bacterium]
MLSRLIHILKRALDEFLPRPDDFDRVAGVSTSGLISIFRLKIVGSHRHGAIRYQAVSPDLFSRCLDQLDIAYPEFTFVDLGCGKGRALLLARKYGFRRLVGVEFAPALVKCARVNVPGAEIVLGDAAEFRFPDTPLVVFLYNPFGSEVLQKVVANLAHSTGWLVYVTPVHGSILRDGGFHFVHGKPAFSVWRLPC